MRLPFATFKKIKLLIPKPASSSYTKERLKYHMLNNNEPPLRSPNAVISVTRRNQRRQETMHKVKMFRTAGLILLISLIAMSCGGSGSSESSNVIIGQGGQVVIDADAVKAAEDKQTGESNTTETLSVEDVDVEELNTETEAVEEDDGIDVATADEDPLDNLLNTVAQFQGCLENDGFEFIGAPGQPGPDGETVDPSSFTPDYIASLQKCATATNIIDAFTAFSEAQENLTPEEIAQNNYGIPVFGECLERLGWEVGEITPDERGQLGFGTNGSGLTPPDDSEGIFPAGDINTCRQEAETYVLENYETSDE